MKRKIFLSLIFLISINSALSASTRDHFLIKSQSYRFQIMWYFGIENTEVYNIERYWPLFDLFAQNWDILKKSMNNDIYDIHFSDGQFTLTDWTAEDLKDLYKNKSYKKIIEFLRAHISKKYSLDYSPRTYNRFYKISVPFKQGDEYPKYSETALFSEFAFGANTSSQNQFDNGYNLIFFDHATMIATEKIIQRYNFTMASRIVIAESMADFLFNETSSLAKQDDNAEKNISYDLARSLKLGSKKDEIFDIIKIPYTQTMNYYGVDIYEYYGFSGFSTHLLKLHFKDEILINVTVDIMGPISVIETYDDLMAWEKDFK